MQDFESDLVSLSMQNSECCWVECLDKFNETAYLCLMGELEKYNLLAYSLEKSVQFLGLGQ